MYIHSHFSACGEKYTSRRLHFASPLQSGFGGQAWVKKFVLNLCFLCFKIPELMLLPTLGDKLISLGGWGNASPPPQLRYEVGHRFKNLCLIWAICASNFQNLCFHPSPIDERFWLVVGVERILMIRNWNYSCKPLGGEYRADRIILLEYLFDSFRLFPIDCFGFFTDFSKKSGYWFCPEINGGGGE